MYKPDEVTAPVGSTTVDYEPHPDGQFVGRCVDVIDLGEKVEQFENNPERLVRKVMLVFVTGEFKEFQGKPELIPLTKEFTLSAHEKAGLRKFVESWRGKSYKDAELEATNGIPLHKLVGAFGVLTVEHKTSRAGRTYAAIQSIVPVMKGVAKPEHLGTEYERPSWLQDKKEQYAKDAAAYRVKIGAPQNAQSKGRSDFNAAPAPQRDDEMPF